MKLNSILFTLLLFTAGLSATLNLQAAEVCVTTQSDPDGDGFGWEQEATCLVVKADDSGATPAEVASRSVVFPRTGEKVDIKRIHWQIDDFADKTFTGCHGYLIDPEQDQDRCVSCDSGESYSYEHFADGNGRLIYSLGKAGFEAEFEWGVDAFGLYFGPMPVKAFAQITDSGIKQWVEGVQGSIGFYEYCEGLIPSSAEEDKKARD